MGDWWLPTTKELTSTTHQVSLQLHTLILLTWARYPERGLPLMAAQSPYSEHLEDTELLTWKNRAPVLWHNFGRQLSKCLCFVCFWVFFFLCVCSHFVFFHIGYDILFYLFGSISGFTVYISLILIQNWLWSWQMWCAEEVFWRHYISDYFIAC